MKNKAIIIFLVILALLGVGAFALFQKPTNQMMMDDTSMGTEEKMMEETSDEMMGDEIMRDKMSDSRYVEYSTSTLNAPTPRRVLYFYASWCPTCRPTDINLTENSDKIPSDMTVIRVNYNDPDTTKDEVALANKYGVTYQHTFVQIDAQGKEVTKWYGGEINKLLANIK